MSAPTVTTPGRLRASQDISAVLGAGRSRVGRHVVVHGRERDDTAGPRVAVIASRKVGTAVRRNRAKRLLRETARATSFREDVDVVLIARHRAADASVHDVAAELAALAEHLDLLDPGPA